MLNRYATVLLNGSLLFYVEPTPRLHRSDAQGWKTAPMDGLAVE